MLRVSMLACILPLAMFTSTTIYSGGLTWLTDPTTDSMPILDCLSPDQSPRCIVHLPYLTVIDEDLRKKDPIGYCTINVNQSIDCAHYDSCMTAASSSVDDPHSCFMQNINMTLPCNLIHEEAYCDSRFAMTPLTVRAAHGVCMCCIVLLILWILTDLMALIAQLAKSRILKVGIARQATIMPEERLKLREARLTRWAEEAKSAKIESSTTGSVCSFAASTIMCASVAGFRNAPHIRSGLLSRNPSKRFESAAWKRQLLHWRDLRLRRDSLFPTSAFGRSIAVVLLSVAALGLCMLVLLFGRSASSFITLPGNLFETVSWFDLVVVLDHIIELVMFLIACVCVHWPSDPIFANHLMKRLEALQREVGSSGQSTNGEGSMQSAEGDRFESIGSDTRSATNSSAGTLESILEQTLTRDVCLLISCEKSAFTEDKERNLVNCVVSALQVFPPGHVYICDHGPDLAPTDCTESVVKSIHTDINYLYLPDCDRGASFYWVNHYWIPYLDRQGKCTKYKYAMLIDDDVYLPANLHIPHEHMKQFPNIQAVSFSMTSLTAMSTGCDILRGLQDLELKVCASEDHLQSMVSSTLTCQKKVSLWDRRLLSQVLKSSDTTESGHYSSMGIALLQMRSSSRMITCPQTLVPSDCPASFASLFHQRVTAWYAQEHRQIFSTLTEVLSIRSMRHKSSVALKPWFIRNVIFCVVDLLRPFVIASLAVASPIALIVLLVIAVSILYLQVGVFQLVYLRKRPDLRSSLTVLLIYPFYRIFLLLLRLCALLHSCLVQLHVRPTATLRLREDEVKDLPPIPPHADVDWSSVWLHGSH